MKFVLEMNKHFAPAHLWLGRTYQELGRFDDALAEKFDALVPNATYNPPELMVAPRLDAAR